MRGYFAPFSKRDGHEWRAAQLQEGEALRAADGFDALWVMGGPMDVRLTEGGTTGDIFDGAPETFRVLQWHGAEVKRMASRRPVPCDGTSVRDPGHAMGAMGVLGPV
jgi:GMP synthase-like glutamine amidotransferase